MQWFRLLNSIFLYTTHIKKLIHDLPSEPFTGREKWSKSLPEFMRKMLGNNTSAMQKNETVKFLCKSGCRNSS